MLCCRAQRSIFTVLQGMELERKDESVFKNQNRALNNAQIVYFVDSIGRQLDKRRVDFSTTLNYISPANTNVIKLARKDSVKSKPIKLVQYIDVDEIYAKASSGNRSGIINTALNNARNNIRVIQQSEEMLISSQRNLNRFGIEWHKKYTFAIACLVFLFIGAPLGAIIRKGGLGMPLVISVVLFIFYWVITTTGEKFARESIPVWEGVWFSTFIFLPAGIFLTYKAANDSVVFNVNSYGEFFKKLFSRLKKKPEEKKDN